MQRIAVVTGANKGIGYEIAKQLLTTCTVVVLACRNKELGEAAVKQLASPKARFMQCDISDAASIAAAMGIRVGELRFLAFSRDVSRVSHYETFRVAKKSGGTRTIRAPRPRLKAAQRWILESCKQCRRDRLPSFEPPQTPQLGPQTLPSQEAAPAPPRAIRAKGWFSCWSSSRGPLAPAACRWQPHGRKA